MKVQDIQQELRTNGIIIRAYGGWASLAKEGPVACKDVVDVCHNAGLCKWVARMRPVGVKKG